jgi:dienelactone hydrolase
MKAAALLCGLLLPLLCRPAAAETISFPSRDADLTGGAPTTITAPFYKPEGKGPFPLVIAAHGCGGMYARGADRLSAIMADWSWRFTAVGWAVLFPDSFNPRGVQRVCEGGAVTIAPGIQRARDIWGAVAWAETRADLRADRMALIGWSHGGSTTLWTNNRASGARPKDLPHDFRAAIAFYPGCGDASRAARFTPVAPLAIFIGTADDWTPAAACRDLAARLPGVGYTEYPGAHHGFDAPKQPLITLQNIATTASHTATYGTNEPAREDAIRKVMAILSEALRQ